MNMWKRFVAWRKAAAMRDKTIKELSSLTARELNDIGISPCDIEFVANDVFKRAFDRELAA